MTVRNDTYAAVRGEVSSLLHLAAQEFTLERGLQDYGRPYDTAFTDDRKVGVLAFALATICHRHPEARKMLQQAINSKAREIALLEQKQRRTHHG